MRPLRVLIIEDSEVDVLLIREMFRRDKIYIDSEVIGNGEEALGRLNQLADEGTLPDLILLDFNVPGLSGKELLDEMGKSGRFESIVIVSRYYIRSVCAWVS